MADEMTWSPWIDHVPGPCPVPVGTWVEVQHADGDCRQGRVTRGQGPYGNEHPCWRRTSGPERVLRYRYRISCAMAYLKAIAKNPQPIEAPEMAE